MAEVLGLLDPLDSIIGQEISDGSDALWNSSDADDDEVKRGKAFGVGTRYYETHACATAALGSANKL